MRCEVGSYQFGKLRRPRVGGDDSLFGDPVFVNGTQRSDRRLAFSRFISADQHAVWLFEVFYCRPLRQELGVRQNLKPQDEFRKKQTARGSRLLE